MFRHFFSKMICVFPLPPPISPLLPVVRLSFFSGSSRPVPVLLSLCSQAFPLVCSRFCKLFGLRCVLLGSCILRLVLFRSLFLRCLRLPVCCSCSIQGLPVWFLCMLLWCRSRVLLFLLPGTVVIPVLSAGSRRGVRVFLFQRGFCRCRFLFLQMRDQRQLLFPANDNYNSRLQFVNAV